MNEMVLWERWGRFAALFIATAAVWGILLRWGVPNFRSWLFTILADPDEGVPRLTRIVETCLKHRIERNDTVAEAMDDVVGRVEAAEASVLAHGAQLKTLKRITDGVPELARILTDIKEGNEKFADRFDDAMREFTDQLGKVREGVARMEGKWDGIERRGHQ